jgi:hypothetical protein
MAGNHQPPGLTLPKSSNWLAECAPVMELTRGTSLNVAVILLLLADLDWVTDLIDKNGLRPRFKRLILESRPRQTGLRGH